MKRVVLTGGPGTGKTTLLARLHEAGYECGDDAARSIIRERKGQGLSPRPAPRDFAAQVLEREIAAYDAVVGGTAFFERGVVDAAASLLGAGAIEKSDAERLVALYPYQAVFLFPPWEEIYCQDEERDQTFDHAIKVDELTRRWYTQHGYTCVDVPRDTPDVRAAFILESIDDASGE